MEFASNERSLSERYKLLIGCIVPRPIGFIATSSASGLNNLAPFSFFNGVSANPPTVAFSIGDRGEEHKDTSRNLEENPELVIHIVSEPVAEQMNVTCGDYGAHVDEFAESGLTAVPSRVVEVPRVAEALVALECRVSHHLLIGDKPPRSHHFLAEILHWHIDDAVINERFHVDASTLRAIGRMGGTEYCRTQDRFAITRPVVTDDDPRSIASFQARQGSETGA